MAASAGEQLLPGRAPVAPRRRDDLPRRGRRFGWRVVMVAVAVTSACLALSACGGGSKGSSSSSSGPAHAGGSLTVLELGGYAGAWPAGLDPATNTSGAANQDQMNAIYGQLFQMTDGAKVIPDLATGYKFLNGGKTVDITLRPSVQFSDGTPLDANAVVFNFKRDFANPCTCKPTWPLDSVTAPDDHTVRINLKAPDGALINQMLVANVNWIASPTALKKMGEQAFRQKPVGAGPFTVVSNTPSSQLVLKKNPNYWDKGKPYLDQLTFKAAANDESALETMQAGGAQAYVGMATPSLVNSFKSKFNVTREPSTSPYNIQLNTSAPPFNDVKARQAIYYATDAKTIDDKLFQNQNPVVQSFTAPAGLFHQGTVPGYPTYDPAKAKALVQQLGGLNVKFFTLRSPVNQDFMVALQTMWKQAGINASIQLYSLSGLIQQFNTKKWQAALQTAGAWDPAAGVGLGFRFLSLSPFSGVHDPKLDGLINQGQGAVDPNQRKQFYDQAGQYIAQQAYSPFLFPLANWNIAAKNVKGPGLTTGIPSIVVNTAPLWEEVTAG